MNPLLTFSEALELLKKGKTVTRSDWYGSEAKPVVKMQVPDKDSKMTEPYLYMEKFYGEALVRFPLDLSCESILSDMWMEV